MNEDKDKTEKSGKRISDIPAIVCLAVILVLYSIYLLRDFSPAIASPDANGYWAQGSLLSNTGHTFFKPENDAQYIGMHWLVTEDGRFFSRYPPGLPVLIGVIYKLFGHEAAILINPALATLSLLVIFLLIKTIANSWWALGGVCALAINSIFNQCATTCNSHMSVTFCLALGLFFLVRWSQKGSLLNIFLSGLLMGCIPTIRYPEALFGLGTALFLLLHYRSRERIWLHYLFAAMGAAIPLLPLLIRNHFAFGAFYRTGYALTNEQTGFGWEYFKSHFVNYIQTLHSEGLGLFFMLGIIGIMVMCFEREQRRAGILFASLIIPSTLLYMSYYWGPEGRAASTMRFLVPIFTCYITAGIWAVFQITRSIPVFARSSLLIILLGAQFIIGNKNTPSRTGGMEHQKKALALITDSLKENIKRNDIVLANPQILQHLDFVRHWRLADTTVIQGVPQRGRFADPNHDPDTPNPMQLKKVEIQNEKFEGMDKSEREFEIALGLRRWAGTNNVYFVGTETELKNTQSMLFDDDSFSIAARIKLPDQPQASDPRNSRTNISRSVRNNPRQTTDRNTQFPGGPTTRSDNPRDRFNMDGKTRMPGGPAGNMRSLQNADEIIIAKWRH